MVHPYTKVSISGSGENVDCKTIQPTICCDKMSEVSKDSLS